MAHNGKEALKEFLDHPVDMVLTDIMMPVMGKEKRNEICRDF